MISRFMILGRTKGSGREAFKGRKKKNSLKRRERFDGAKYLTVSGIAEHIV